MSIEGAANSLRASLPERCTNEKRFDASAMKRCQKRQETGGQIARALTEAMPALLLSSKTLRPRSEASELLLSD
jgi:hypothetical protein